ncbi:MAG: hypothetical protein ACI9FJ_002005 [Alteromonadaceae bacterium]|jgi:hypothetical protein
MIEALPNNVTLYENTLVTNIKNGEPHTISCKQGEVIADNLTIAVNGYMPIIGIKEPGIPFAADRQFDAPVNG